MSDQQIRNHAVFIWSVADKLRGVYKQSEYGRVILPLVVLRRLDCVLEPTKAAVLARHAALKHVDNVAPVLESVSGQGFYNTSALDFRRLLDDPSNVAGHLREYIAAAAHGFLEDSAVEPCGKLPDQHRDLRRNTCRAPAGDLKRPAQQAVGNAVSRNASYTSHEVGERESVRLYLSSGRNGRREHVDDEHS